jgi:hypothetical protein
MKVDRHPVLPGRKHDNTVFPCSWTPPHTIRVFLVRLFFFSGRLIDVRKCDEFGKSTLGFACCLLVFLSNTED